VAPKRPPREDEDAGLFAELYEPLHRFAAVVAPIETEPDDLLQEAVARVLRRQRLSDLEDAGAYLRRTMVNLASNQRRSFAVRRRALARLAAGSSPDPVVYPSDLSFLLELPPAERAVLYLTEVEGMQYADAGRLLGCSETTARKRAQRGRRRLHAVLVGEVSRG
jgi:DNA-directed RNA polymerase specialized sigma24 family protein